MVNQRIHGGPDSQGAAVYDFSTNSNACGPCPSALAVVQASDPTCYPDSGYTALRLALANFHGVAPERVVLAGSASEFIFRMTAMVHRQGGSRVHIPTHAYGDYAHAAQAWGLQRVAEANTADLVWACDPSSPLGQTHTDWPTSLARCPVVLDCAYAPLRLSGVPAMNPSQRDAVWQLYSPNKALGLTGIRAAYAIASADAGSVVERLDAMAPSWVIGAHGVGLLTAWTLPATQAWLAASLTNLRAWKQQQIAVVSSLGWSVEPSRANFFCAQPPADFSAVELCNVLRQQGIKLRDASSFGLSGFVRLGVLPPLAQLALAKALASASVAKGEGVCK